MSFLIFCAFFAFLLETTSCQAVDRIKEELAEIAKSPPGYASAGPTGANIFEWTATIMGPPDSPYKEGVFFVSISFPTDYPDSPPAMNFVTRIYHPNINANGNIGLAELGDGWSSDMTVSSILVKISDLLSTPISETHVLVPMIDHLLKTDPTRYRAMAQLWTQKYAQ